MPDLGSPHSVPDPNLTRDPIAFIAVSFVIQSFRSILKLSDTTLSYHDKLFILKPNIHDCYYYYKTNKKRKLNKSMLPEEICSKYFEKLANFMIYRFSYGL